MPHHPRRAFLQKSVSSCFMISALNHPARSSAQGQSQAIRNALEKAVSFFTSNAAKHGGYVYNYSADLKFSEGEVTTGPDTVWVQPPGTPEVGQALLDVYHATGLELAKTAAINAGRCLVNGQLQSGGWSDKIEFDPAQRKKIAYRVDPPPSKSTKKRFNVSTFDDDKSQSAIRFLLNLNQLTNAQLTDINSSLHFALDSVISAQFPNGAFAQGWSEPADTHKPAHLKATYPQSWPRTYPGGDYWLFYTFNDGNIDNIIATLLLADRLTAQPRFRQAALKAADFILTAQLPDPQPAWAQQYNFQLQPVWARKFEPPAISGSESQRLLNTLMDTFIETGNRAYLEPIPKALQWFQKVALTDGKLARFYELQTDRPLYFTRDYKLTYDDSDLPTHYAFKVENRSARLLERYNKILAMSERQILNERNKKRLPVPLRLPSDAQLASILTGLDNRGAWVEQGQLKKQPTGQIISSETFVKNIRLLAAWLQANSSPGSVPKNKS